MEDDLESKRLELFTEIRQEEANQEPGIEGKMRELVEHMIQYVNDIRNAHQFFHLREREELAAGLNGEGSASTILTDLLEPRPISLSYWDAKTIIYDVDFSKRNPNKRRKRLVDKLRYYAEKYALFRDLNEPFPLVVEPDVAEDMRMFTTPGQVTEETCAVLGRLGEYSDRYFQRGVMLLELANSTKLLQKYYSQRGLILIEKLEQEKILRQG